MIANTCLLLLVCTLGLLTPGPDMMLILKNSLTGNRKAAFATVWGVCAAILVHMTYCVLGLGYLLTHHPLIFKIAQYAGATYLIYVGVQALRHTNRGDNAMGETLDSGLSQRLGFAQGFWNNLLNPKAAFFFIALFAEMFSAQVGLPMRIYYAGVVTLHAFVAWTLLVLLLQSRAIQQFVMRSRKMVEVVFGTVLIALGVKVALTR